MARMFYDQDANLEALRGRKIAVIGFGSQGHAHALNLKDSGCDVRVGLYEGSASWKRAAAAGLAVMPTAAATAEAEIVMMLVPEQVAPPLYREAVAPHLGKGDTLMFAHGFNIHFNQIVPPAGVDVSMVAPKAPGHRVREIFPQGQGV